MNKVLLIFLSLFIFNTSFATIYYSQVSVGGGRDVTQVSNWKTAVGSGSSPASFLSGDEFHIVSADSMMASTSWVITGAKLVIESGKFNSSGFSHTFTLDMLASGYYYHMAGNYTNVSFGSLNSSSGFEFRTGNFIPSRTYPNLVLNIPSGFAINGNPVVQGSLSIIGPGTVAFANTSASSITIAGDLNISKGVLIGVNSTLNSTVVVGGNLNMSGGSTALSQGSGILSMNISGNLNATSGSLTLSRNNTGTGAVSLSVSGSVNITAGTFIGTANGASANPSLSVGGNCTIASYYYAQNGLSTTGIPTLTLAGSGSFSINNLSNYNHYVNVTGSYTLGSNLLVGKDLVINGGNLSISNKTLSLYNALTITSGTLNGGLTSNLSVLSPSSVDINLPAITLGTLLINRSGQTVSMTGDVTIGTSLNLTAGTFSIGANTLTCKGGSSGSGTLLGGFSSNLIISGSSGFNLPSLTLKDLTMDRIGQNLILTGPVTVGNNLNLINGQINNSTQVLTISNGATIVRDNGNIATTPTLAGFYNLSYTGTSAVTTANELVVGSPNKLDNLSISKTGGVNLNKNIEVNQTLTINVGGVLNSSFYTIQADGNWVNDGTFNASTGTVNFYGNSTISGTPSGGHNFNIVSIGAGATLTAPLSTNVNLSGNFISSATSVFNHNNGTITFSGSGGQSIPCINFYNLTSTGAGFRVLSNSGTIGIAGTFTVGTNTYNTGPNTIDFNGTAAQNIPSFTFYNLTISGNNVKTLNAGNITVKGILTFNSGVIATGVNKVIINSTGSVSGGGTGNYVHGNLQKNFNAGSNIARTFEVGDVSNYAPITTTFATVSVSGNITASTTSGDHAQIASSCIDGTKSVNRFWTLSNSGVSPVNYGAVLNFVAGDLDAGTDFNNFGGARYSGSWLNLTPGTKTANSIQFTGVTSFGDFQVGESNAPVSVSIAANPGVDICPATSVTFTATPVNGGTSPTYSWTKNGLPVGSNSATYIDNTLNSGDVIVVDMVSNSPCTFQPNATSNSLVISNSGCTYTWTGASSSAWSTASNWSFGIVPDSINDAIIPSGPVNMPAITGSVNVKSLTINSGGPVLTLNSASTLNIFGDLSNSGTFTDNGATTLFKGSSAQTITGATNFNHLTLNNTSGLTLNSAVTVTGILSLVNGAISSNGNLTVDLNSGTIGYNTTDLGSISGNIKVQKNVNFTKTHDIACPLSGTTANDLNDDTQVLINGGTRLKIFNSITQAYNDIMNLNTPLRPDTGYALFFAAPTVLDFTGTYNHGATFLAATCPNSVTNNSLLVANPYPSTLDWTIGSGWTKTGITDALYIWDAQHSRYASYINNSSVNGGTQYVPALQAFFVVTDGTGGTASVSINNNARLTSPNPVLWRQAADINKLKVTLSSGQYSDEALIRFNSNATDLYDNAFDAYKMINPDSTPSVYSGDLNTSYSINTLPKADKRIPLNVNPGFSGVYTLAIEASDFDAANSVVLEDKLLNVKRKLNGNDQYTFTSNQGDKADRFSLIVSFSGNNNIDGKVLIGSYDKTINLTFNNAGNTASIMLYDLMGKQVNKIDNADITSGLFSYTDSNLSEGLYIVKVVVGSELYSGKVFIK
jgi:hypothetical protein